LLVAVVQVKVMGQQVELELVDLEPQQDLL
jgi:hypothetical protein